MVLVDMYHLWPHFAHNLAKLRIVVQVKVAIQSHWRNNHAISSRVEAFKDLLATIITLPVWGCHEG